MQPSATTHLLYLHGFRSSPLSAKSRHMATAVQQAHPSVVWWAPQLPPSPQEAMRSVLHGIEAWPSDTMAVVGSSLGGFYARHVAYQRGCTCVLLNPAVDPARDLAQHIGEHSLWHTPEEHFYFAPEYVQELKDLECGPLPTPQRTLAVIATGDEVLDWHEMRAAYAQCHLRIVDGSDHGLTDFAEHLPTILDFLKLA